MLYEKRRQAVSERRRQRSSAKTRKRKVRFRPTGKFYAVVGGFAAIVILLILLISGIKKAVPAENGAIRFETSASGIIIRSENLYQTENYGKSVFLASEGQRVGTGTIVADVYTWDYSDSVVSQLKTLQDKIMDYQQQSLLGGNVSEEMAELNKQIEQKSDHIVRVLEGTGEGHISTLEKELRALMDARTSLLYESVQVDDTLSGYIEQEATIKARIDQWKKTITAASDGLISFYFDGCETLLTPDNMKKLEEKQITDILNGKTFYTITDTTASRPLYRLVDENEWYVVMLSDKKITEFDNSNIFRVTMNGETDTVYTATIDGFTEAHGTYIYYLKFQDSIKNLLLARAVDMQISYDYTGIMVSEDAIVESGGQKGVYMQTENGKEFVPVNVLIIREGKAIIEPIDLKSGLSTSSIVYE